ncbi:MAG: phenylacetate--CoA ligase, partial [Actinobacteria bacterium]
MARIVAGGGVDAMYQPELEMMPRAELEAVQLERMKALLQRVYDNVPLYRDKFDKAGFDPASFES